MATNPETRPAPRGGPIRPTATSAELQADIDRGLTGEKVAAFDPAASPLGTDEEAGGAPTSPEVLADERRRAREALAQSVDRPKGRRVNPAVLLAAGALALGAAVAVAMLG